jgi:hypothetical protein
MAATKTQNDAILQAQKSETTDKNKKGLFDFFNSSFIIKKYFDF